MWLVGWDWRGRAVDRQQCRQTVMVTAAWQGSGKFRVGQGGPTFTIAVALRGRDYDVRVVVVWGVEYAGLAAALRLHSLRLGFVMCR
jgi:hypothetical protein